MTKQSINKNFLGLYYNETSFWQINIAAAAAAAAATTTITFWFLFNQT